MKSSVLAVLCLFSIYAKAQGDKNLAANGSGDTRLIIGIVIAVLVVIVMYLLLRKDDK
jgi:hypothetical protein